MALVFKPFPITDKHNKILPGTLAVCENCESHEFLVMFVDKQTHPHFQCVGCTTSYCDTFDGSQCSDWEGVN
jgi:hypothetical protein